MSDGKAINELFKQVSLLNDKIGSQAKEISDLKKERRVVIEHDDTALKMKISAVEQKVESIKSYDDSALSKEISMLNERSLKVKDVTSAINEIVNQKYVNELYKKVVK